MYVTAIIAAGGLGQRFGGEQPKQLLAIGGRPMLERSVDAFLGTRRCTKSSSRCRRRSSNNPPPYLRSAAAGALDGPESRCES